jgi:hypothetical protein
MIKEMIEARDPEPSATWITASMWSEDDQYSWTRPGD